MTADPNTIDPLKTLIRESSLTRLRSISELDDIIISDITNEPIVLAHWMSFILVSGKVLRTVIKVHFNTDSAQFFASRMYQTYKDNVTQPQAFDFIKEFCNVTAGQIKVILANNNVKVGFSLPGMTRGFDEIYYQNLPKSTKDCWRLECRGARIDCSASIEIYDGFNLENVSETKKSKEGDVEFLD